MTVLDVLVVGGGGREHALIWALRRSAHVGMIYAAPGNAGTAQIAQNVSINAEDITGLVQFVQSKGVGLVIVGPEAPLSLGLVDVMTQAGIRAFGPTQAAAQLETSKAFSKTFMREVGIPTAAYAVFEAYEPAVTYVRECGHAVVVKADGLAAGKGVVVCDAVSDAEAALKMMLVDRVFSEAGGRVIIEKRLTGPEVSVLAFCDGKTAAVMPPARDHKRIFDGDEGPNTGGMGAFTPPLDVSPALVEEICRTVLQPAVEGMAARGTPYVGVLYAGLILTPDGPRTLEFNCRFGDPETQAILPLLESDLLDIFEACIDGSLSRIKIQWKTGACAAVVAAAPGYPGEYPKGLPITGLDQMEGCTVFHAGTAQTEQGRLVTSGGRVLAVSAAGDTLDAALEHAYAGMAHIHFEGIHYRRDIGRVRAE